MDRSNVITLIGETETRNKYGVWESIKTSRDVFCQKESVTRAEFFDGGRNGLNPEFKFVVFFADYQGERELSYDGKSYAVYRTYQAKTDVLELYVERKGGTNGKQNSSGQAI